MILSPTDRFSGRIQSRFLSARMMAVTLGHLFPMRGQPWLLCPVTGVGRTLSHPSRDPNSRKEVQRRNFFLDLGKDLS